MRERQFFLTDEQATLDLGKELARIVPDELIVFLQGDLGVGKTTLVRGFLQGLGHQGAVKSPTYTLVEPYFLQQKWIYHFDLYRLTDAEELEIIGVRDYFGQSICFVEWPENGKGHLPKEDIHCYIKVEKRGRFIRIESCSDRGDVVLKQLVVDEKRN